MRKGNPKAMSATLRKKYEAKRRRDFDASYMGTKPKHPPREPRPVSPVYRVGRDWFVVEMDGTTSGPFANAIHARRHYRVYGVAA